jgi:hypothetical protein
VPAQGTLWLPNAQQVMADTKVAREGAAAGGATRNVTIVSAVMLDAPGSMEDVAAAAVENLRRLLRLRLPTLMYAGAVLSRGLPGCGCGCGRGHGHATVAAAAAILLLLLMHLRCC